MQDVLLFLVQRCERPMQIRDLSCEQRFFLGHLHDRIGLILRVSDKLWCIIDRDRQLLGLTSVVIPHLGDRDGKHPSFERFPLRFVPVNRLERLKKRLSRQILRNLGVSRTTQQKPEDGLVVRIVQPPERFGIRLCLFDDHLLLLHKNNG